MRILVVSYVYPLIKEYLSDFFYSLNKQSMKCDFLVYLDKFKEDIRNYNYNGQIEKNKNNLSIPSLRKFTINKAVENNFDLLIFCDADDVMKENRVEKIIEEYKKTNGKYGFYYNNLYTLKEKEDFYKGNLPNEVSNVSELEKYNFLGMSHTAINLKSTKEIWKDFIINDDIIAFDWYMHSYILDKGFKGKKVDTITYYRIYENNIAGNTNILNEKKLNIGIKVKKAHYKIMSDISSEFEVLYRKIEELEKELKDIEFKENYIKLVNEKFYKSVFWWENIKTLDEVGGFLK